MTDVAANLSFLKERIDAAAKKSGRSGEDIKLICVSKTVDTQRVLEAYNAGERDFGENRVQEYIGKREKMPPDCRWHIIGRLQTNKVKYIINGVYMLQSLDRMKLAAELQKELLKAGTSMDVLLEVNTAKEESKAGFLPEELPFAAEEIAGMDNLRVRGLMTVAPFTDDSALLKTVFEKTKDLYDSLKNSGYPNFDFKWLSMGMSGDFELAIAAGANMIRVGSSIFGQRIYK